MLEPAERYAACGPSTSQIASSEVILQATIPTHATTTNARNFPTTSPIIPPNKPQKSRNFSNLYTKFKSYKRARGNVFMKNRNTENNDYQNNFNNNSSSITDIHNNFSSMLNESGNDDFYLEARILDTIDEISIIGFRHCVDTNRSLLNRLMWIILILTGFFLAVYQINDRIVHYFYYPTNAEIDVVPSQNMTFPRVTVCSDNYIKYSSAQALGLVEYYKQFMSPFAIGPVNESKMVINIPTLTNASEVIKKRKFLSPGMEQMILCFWNGGRCPDNFVHMEFTNLGQCFYISPRKRHFYVTRPGAMLGIMFILDANISDYFIQPSTSAGFRVLLHEPNEPPRMMELGFKVHLGQSINLAISVTNITRQKPPYGTCTDKEDYNQVDCEWKCLNKQIVKNCSCRPIYMKAIGNETVCDYYEERSCAEVVIDDFYLKKSNGEISCYCPPACNEITYQTSVTGSNFGKNFVSHLTTVFPHSYEHVMENQIFLYIYLSSMQYTKLVTTEGYSVMSLLSDLGGALGLILGSTFLTVIEIVELFIDFVVYGYAKRNEYVNKNKNKKNKSFFEKTRRFFRPIIRKFERRIKSKEKIEPYVVYVE